jgi:hypothetical protein
VIKGGMADSVSTDSRENIGKYFNGILLLYLTGCLLTSGRFWNFWVMYGGNVRYRKSSLTWIKETFWINETKDSPKRQKKKKK